MTSEKTAAFTNSNAPHDKRISPLPASLRILPPEQLHPTARPTHSQLAGNCWVVAIFPRFFEQVREIIGLPLGDIGTGGIFGFEEDHGNRNEVAYLRGDHGAAIRPENHESLARFVQGIDQRPKPDSQLAEKIPTWLSMLRR
jgi:hypothetical protein